MENTITSYNLKCRKGFLGDFATEWWTDEDYTKHDAHVKQLIADGTYGQEYEIALELVHNPLYDDTSLTPSLVSSKLEFLDFSNYQKTSSTN